MHADRAIHAVVDDDHDDRQIILYGGREFLPVHQEIAVARETHDHPFRRQAFRADRGRQAVAHGAGIRRKLAAEPLRAQKAPDADRKIARAIGEDGVGREIIAQLYERLSVLHRAGRGRRGVRPCEIIHMRGLRRARPGNCLRRLQRGETGAERHGRRVDREGGIVYAPEFLGAGVHMYQRLPRLGYRK